MYSIKTRRLDLSSRDVPSASHPWGLFPLNVQGTYVAATAVQWFKTQSAAQSVARNQDIRAYAIGKRQQQ